VTLGRGAPALAEPSARQLVFTGASTADGEPDGDADGGADGGTPVGGGIVTPPPPTSGVTSQFGTCGFDCRTREVFSPAKAAFCCRVAGVGCPAAPSPTPSAAPAFNCRTREVFSAAKAAFCCRDVGVGCPAAPSSTPLPSPTRAGDVCARTAYRRCTAAADCGAPAEWACVDVLAAKPRSCRLRRAGASCAAFACSPTAAVAGAVVVVGGGNVYKTVAAAAMGHCSPVKLP